MDVDYAKFPKKFNSRTIQGNYLNLGEKIKIYPHDQVLTFLMTPQIWLFHVAVWLTKAKEWTTAKNARAGRAKLLFLPTKYVNL